MASKSPTNATRTEKQCPLCSATRFEKRVLYEIVDGEERVVETEYRCYNHHTNVLENLTDRVIAAPETGL